MAYGIKVKNEADGSEAGAIRADNSDERIYTFPDVEGTIALEGVDTVSITGAGSLTSTAFNKLHLCSGTSTNYTVDLPTAVGNTGGIVVFKGVAALTKVVTIAGSSGQTIDGESSRQISTLGMISLLSDGANWIVVQEVGSWIDYTPVLAGFSADPTIDRSQYYRVGKTCTVIHHQSASGTSNATTKTVTLPFVADSVTTQSSIMGSLINNGVASTTPGSIVTRVGSNIADLYTNYAGGAWTASASVARFNFIFTYKIS